MTLLGLQVQSISQNGVCAGSQAEHVDLCCLKVQESGERGGAMTAIPLVHYKVRVKNQCRLTDHVLL